MNTKYSVVLLALISFSFLSENKINCEENKKEYDIENTEINKNPFFIGSNFSETKQSEKIIDQNSSAQENLLEKSHSKNQTTATDPQLENNNTIEKKILNNNSEITKKENDYKEQSESIFQLSNFEKRLIECEKSQIENVNKKDLENELAKKSDNTFLEKINIEIQNSINSVAKQTTINKNDTINQKKQIENIEKINASFLDELANLNNKITQLYVISISTAALSVVGFALYCLKNYKEKKIKAKNINKKVKKIKNNKY